MKLCGNCGGFHEIKDCELIMVKKIDFLKNKEEAEKWRTHLRLVHTLISSHLRTESKIIKRLKKGIEELELKIKNSHSSYQDKDKQKLKELQKILGDKK